VLPGAGLGDEAGLAHPFGQQGLADGIVDLVAARVVEILTLEEHAGAAAVLGEPRGLGEQGRPADVVSLRSRSSSVKFGSTWDLRQVSSISSSAGISASGMNLPPNAPKYGPVSWLT